VRGFVPASQIDTRFVEDLSTYVGQRLTFEITRYEARNLVLSRRALLEKENEKRAAETRKVLVPGVVLHGRVTSFKPYGAFVDIGGVEGMLHVSELGYARVEKPEDVLRVDQEIDVVVLKIDGDRISLSLKALGDDPWNAATAKLAQGQRVTGTITRLQPFGAFVEIAPGVEGLVHISELGAGRRINHPKEVVSVGQAVEATVLGIDHERRRLSLSMTASDDAAPHEVAAAVTRAPDKLGTFGAARGARRREREAARRTAHARRALRRSRRHRPQRLITSRGAIGATPPTARAVRTLRSRRANPTQAWSGARRASSTCQTTRARSAPSSPRSSP
jgi:small subunit ribosomal protein S1